MLDAPVLEAAARDSTMSISQRGARSGAYPGPPHIVPLAVPLLAGPVIQLCHGKQRAWQPLPI
jgi:small neutral amino acid transporter SnatA (MarC family)